MKLNLTTKQRWILTELIKGHTDKIGERHDMDLDQLIDALTDNKAYPGYGPTKAAIQFSIRYLVKKGLAEKGDTEKRRGRARRILRATPLGIQVCLPKSTPGSAAEQDGVISEGFDDEVYLVSAADI